MKTILIFASEKKLKDLQTDRVRNGRVLRIHYKVNESKGLTRYKLIIV